MHQILKICSPRPLLAGLLLFLGNLLAVAGAVGGCLHAVGGGGGVASEVLWNNFWLEIGLNQVTNLGYLKLRYW